jgi:hypothetical protein
MLDLRPIPATLPWLDQNPFIVFRPVTGIGLLLSTGIWLGIWIAALLVGPIAWRRLVRHLRARWRPAS